MTAAIEKPPIRKDCIEAASAIKPNQPCPASKKHVAQLIGKKCMVSCAINGAPIQMLLDSGAQVTIVDRKSVV